jgi:hypothetical protein
MKMNSFLQGFESGAVVMRIYTKDQIVATAVELDAARAQILTHISECRKLRQQILDEAQGRPLRPSRRALSLRCEGELAAYESAYGL